MKPAVSVIIPVYKTEKYLRRCVDSVLNQTFTDLEVILVDDGSPDGCPGICDAYAKIDSRVKVIHKTNGGQAEARNTGLSNATGEYVIFVDSDDWIDPRLCEKVLQHAPFESAVFGVTYTYADGSPDRIIAACSVPTVLNWADNGILAGMLIKNSLFGYACNKFYRRDLIDQSRFHFAPLREDLLFNIEVFSRTSAIVLIDCAGYYYYQHSSSTLSGRYSGNVPDICSVAAQMTKVHPALPSAMNRELGDHLVKQYLSDAIYKFLFTNDSQSRKDVLEHLTVIFSDPIIRNTILIQPGDNRLFLMLAICCKLKLPGVFYSIMRHIWRR